MGKLSKTKTSWKKSREFGWYWKTRALLPKPEKTALYWWVSEERHVYWTAAAKPLGAACTWDTSPWRLAAWPLRNVETPCGLEHFLVPELTSSAASQPWLPMGHLQKAPRAVPCVLVTALRAVCGASLPARVSCPSMLWGQHCWRASRQAGLSYRGLERQRHPETLDWCSREWMQMHLNKWESHEGGEVGRQILFFWYKPSTV